MTLEKEADARRLASLKAEQADRREAMRTMQQGMHGSVNMRRLEELVDEIEALESKGRSA